MHIFCKILYCHRNDTEVRIRYIFTQYSTGSCIISVVSHIVLRKLSFLLIDNLFCGAGKYREFHVMYQEGRYEEAAALLVSLIASRLAPE